MNGMDDSPPSTPTGLSAGRNGSSPGSSQGSNDAGRDESDMSNQNDNNIAMPATPLNPRQAERGIPSTPLTPLSVVDNDQASADENSVNNDGEEEGNDDGFPQEQHGLAGDMIMDNDAETTTLARGTDVNVHSAAATFQAFLREFKSLERSRDQNEEADGEDASDSDVDDSTVDNLYMTKLRSLLHQTASCSLEIDMMHIYFHNRSCQKFYHQLVSYPMELVPLMDLVVQRELRELALQSGLHDDVHPNDIPLPSIQVRPFNLKQVSNLRCLDPVAMDSLVCLKGMIVRCSPIIPDLKVAHFQCVICGHDVQVSIDRGRIQEPHQCPSCNMKESYQLAHNRCLFADKQLVRLQETPDQVPAGQTPASAITFCFDDLVDACQPGDKVEITGVLRAQPIRVNPKITKLKSIYKTYVDVIHFKAVTGMERPVSASSSTLSEQYIQKLTDLSKRSDIYDQLTQSLAPSIWGLDDVKKGVLCMLFGGNHRRVKDSKAAKPLDESAQDDEDDWSAEEENNTNSSSKTDQEDTKLNKRGDINILLCGDPGTSKSQLLSYVHKLSTRGVYTSGKGSSAVGLTASVVRDQETRDLVLESGALVLSDRGICCIDEFDKMSDATRSILHEAMEQQTVSIAKAGIIASLNARTSILASANPLESRYNPNLSVVENIKLPPTLLSRFDLIYLILDSPNVDQDRHLAQHLVGLYYESPNVVEPPMDNVLLRDYIGFARDNIHPSLSDEASDELLASYLELRNPPGGSYRNNGTRTISATPRQLESLVRLSEGLAKMRYSKVVLRSDAVEALRLLKVATQAAATDPRTGKIDMDMITTGRTSVDRESEEQLYIGLKELLVERRGNRLAVRDVLQQMTEISDAQISQDALASALRRMDADGIIQFNERAQSVYVKTGILG